MSIRDATDYIIHVCRYCNTLVEDVTTGCQNCDTTEVDIYITSPNQPLPDALLDACGEHARSIGELPESPALMLLDEINRLRAERWPAGDERRKENSHA